MAYTNWGYPPDFIPVPWDFTSDFEEGQNAFLLQWWDPRYNGGDPVYPATNFYNIGVSPYATIEAHATAPSGDNVLHFEVIRWGTPPNEWLTIGGLEYAPTRFDSLSVKFYFLIDAPQPVEVRGIWLFSDDALYNIGLHYANDLGQDLIRLPLPDGTTQTFARSDSWQLFEYYVDYMTGAWSVSLDGAVIGSGTELDNGYIPPEDYYFSIGGNLLSNTEAEYPAMMGVNFYIDALEVVMGPGEEQTWSCDCETARFESQFGDYAYESGGVRDDFPVTTVEGDNTFLRFDDDGKRAEKGFSVYPINEFSFDVRMPSAEVADSAVFYLPYTVSIEGYHDVSFYDYATLVYIFYDAETDRFRLDTTQYGSGTLIYPYMGEDVDVSWPRPTDWQRIRVRWDYHTRELTLWVDGVELTTYTVQAFEDLTEWTDMWGYTFYPTGVNWIGWLYPHWGDTFVGSLGAFRSGALIDLDNINFSGEPVPYVPHWTLGNHGELISPLDDQPKARVDARRRSLLMRSDGTLLKTQSARGRWRWSDPVFDASNAERADLLAAYETAVDSTSGVGFISWDPTDPEEHIVTAYGWWEEPYTGNGGVRHRCGFTLEEIG